MAVAKHDINNRANRQDYKACFVHQKVQLLVLSPLSTKGRFVIPW